MMLTEGQFSQNVFNFVRLNSRVEVNPELLMYSQERRFDTDSIIHSLVGTFLTNKIGKDYLRYKIPSSWWQMFKRDILYKCILTRWYVDKFPILVKTESIQYDKYAVCPHVNVPRNKDHFEYLSTEWETLYDK